jgi:hypothetical protein
MENYQKLVSSRGILRGCDVFNRSPQSSSPLIDFAGDAQLPSGGAIYCCTDALETFASEVIDSISMPFVLVSGDSDTVVSPQTLAGGVFEKILAHPTLVRWFAQNIGAAGEELHFLPIGLDYHTMWERPWVWRDSVRRSAFEQERTLLGIRDRAAPVQERKPLIYCNWHFALHDRRGDGTPVRSERIECLEQVARSLCFFEPTFVPRYRTWGTQTEYAFVLSPAGNGPDTHRLWEALVLGCIPIVRRNFLSQFLSDLPVIVVEDWREITAEFLERSFADMWARRFNFGKLYLEYWRRAIRGMEPDAPPPMTLAQYHSEC